MTCQVSFLFFTFSLFFILLNLDKKVMLSVVFSFRFFSHFFGTKNIRRLNGSDKIYANFLSYLWKNVSENKFDNFLAPNPDFIAKFSVLK